MREHIATFDMTKTDLAAIMRMMSVFQPRSEDTTVLGIDVGMGGTSLVVFVTGSIHGLKLTVPVNTEDWNSLYARFLPAAIRKAISSMIDGMVTVEIVADEEKVDLFFTDSVGQVFPVAGAICDRPDDVYHDGAWVSADIDRLYSVSRLVTAQKPTEENPSDFGECTEISVTQTGLSFVSGDQISLHTASVPAIQRDPGFKPANITVSSFLLMFGIRMLYISTQKGFPGASLDPAYNNKKMNIYLSDNRIVVENQDITWWCSAARVAYPTATLFLSKSPCLKVYGAVTIPESSVSRMIEAVSIGKSNLATITIDSSNHLLVMNNIRIPVSVQGGDREVTVSAERLKRYLRLTKNSLTLMYREYPLQPVNIVEMTTGYEIILGQNLPA